MRGAVLGVVLAGAVAANAAFADATGTGSVGATDEFVGAATGCAEANNGGAPAAGVTVGSSGLSFETTMTSTTIAPMATVDTNPRRMCSDDDFFAGGGVMSLICDACVSAGATPGIEASVPGCGRGSVASMGRGGGVCP